VEAAHLDLNQLVPLCLNSHSCLHFTNAHTLSMMYHLLKGLHTHLTRKDEYSVVIIGLDNVRPHSFR
jgi:hypothetical protein